MWMSPCGWLPDPRIVFRSRQASRAIEADQCGRCAEHPSQEHASRSVSPLDRVSTSRDVDGVEAIEGHVGGCRLIVDADCPARIGEVLEDDLSR